MRFRQSKNNTLGFTLIELVVVIVILGILAVTVAPKYINLSADAHTATLEAVKGSLEGASALVYSKSIVAGNQNESLTSITLSNGDSLSISYGYPLVPPPFLVDTYWRGLIDVSDEFVIAANTGGVLIIYPKSMDAPANSTSPCIVTFKASLGINIPPEINIFECS